MPNNFDFNNIKSVQTIKINPVGWINPLTIEYGIYENPEINALYGGNNNNELKYYWRVKGTKHTFSILVSRLNYISSGDYAKHFSEVLELFKTDDYDYWKKRGFDTEWMREYRDDYKGFIL